MKRRRGQAVVEFALIAPMVFLMVFAMIYGGFMFMEYLHYSNAVRTVARQIAVSEKTGPELQTLINDKKDWLENLWENEASVRLYKPTVTITSESTDVEVIVTFKMEDSTYNSLPNLLKSESSFGIGFPPKKINALQYSMKIENNS